MNHYSQNDEQEVILEFFGERIGQFLDIGAFDGPTLSNTWALVELGWHGTMVEPNPCSVVKLMNSVHQLDNPERIQIIAAACSPRSTPVILRMDDTEERGWAASIAPENPRVWKPSPVRLFVPTISPRELVNLFGLSPFHFISIDAELMDFDILRQMPRHLGGCELLCIEPEDLGQREEMKQLLVNEFNMIIHHETHENIMARKK